MPVSALLELAKGGNYEQFESRCVELLADGQLSFASLIAPFEQFDKAGQGEKLAPLTQTIFENADPKTDPKAALQLARVALIASPKSDALRQTVLSLYRVAYADLAALEAVVEASGISGGRPVRMALKLLDFCLDLKPGDPLISRSDDRVVEVVEIDLPHTLFTLRRESRTTTLPAPEVVRDFDRVSPDDFRVLRQLQPDRLADLLRNDPVAVVIGILHAHGEHIDTDQLKDELVPRFIDEKDWSGWWTKARTAIKKSPHMIMEGRSPVILRFSPQGQTLEQEAWKTLESQKEPADWLATIESYLREKASLGEPQDAAFLERVIDHLAKHVTAVRKRRPEDALQTSLALLRLGEKGLAVPPEAAEAAASLLREARNPTGLLTAIATDALRDRGIEVAEKVCENWAEHAVRWLPSAPAHALDRLVNAALDGGKHDAVQAVIDAALDECADHPELIYWMWRGPKIKGDVRLPADLDLFRLILDTFSALGRTVSAEPKQIKEFRARMKAALSIKDYDKARTCLQQCSEAAAIIIRRQLQRLEGAGPTVQARLLDLLRDVHPSLWVVKPKKVDPWADPETVWTTAAGLARRTAERDTLVNVTMRENARRIGEAASLGDLSENSEYKFALEERDLLRARLAAMNDELSRARKIEPSDVPTDSIGIGSRVTLRRLEDGVERVISFLGPFDTDVEKGIYSYQAPVAQKLMGRQVGERVEVSLEGRDVAYEIVALGNAAAG